MSFDYKHGLNQKCIDFIQDNLRANPHQLFLKYAGKTALPYTLLIEQIDARQRLKTKFAEWANHPTLLFPPKLSIEQASSDITALYKSKLLQGKTLVDLTGGFGIDSYYFAKRFNDVHYCELQPHLCEILSYNMAKLEMNNIHIHNVNGIEYLKSVKQVDCAYLDPARRDQDKKLVSLKDCLPDVTEYIDLLLTKAKTVLIKTSPLLDIKKGVEELKYVSEIHVVSVKNECKELLFKLEKESIRTIIKTVNFLSNGDRQLLDSEWMNKESSPIGNLNNYLYEPNASIMKAGIFSKLCKNFNVIKLHPNSNVYTSKELIQNFPGKVFKVLESFNPYKKKFKNEYLNIVCRNYHEKPEVIRKKLKSKDGGARFLFATTNKDEKRIFILCERLD